MNVYIDNNVWNYFFDNKIQIDSYFSQDEFKLLITLHGEYEIEQMPDSCSNLKQYIKGSLNTYVSVDSIFGFHNPDLPDDQQRVVGFDQGRFTSVSESIIKSGLYLKYGSKKKRKETQILFEQEADIELASRAMKNVVITFDSKKGPLKETMQNGGKIVFLNYKESLEMPVDIFMRKLIEKVSAYKI